MIEFTDADVEVEQGGADLVIRLIAGPLQGIELRGRFTLLKKVILTGVTLGVLEAATIAAKAAAWRSATGA